MKKISCIIVPLLVVMFCKLEVNGLSMIPIFDTDSYEEYIEYIEEEKDFFGNRFIHYNEIKSLGEFKGCCIHKDAERQTTYYLKDANGENIAITFTMFCGDEANEEKERFKEYSNNADETEALTDMHCGSGKILLNDEILYTYDDSGELIRTEFFIGNTEVCVFAGELQAGTHLSVLEGTPLPVDDSICLGAYSTEGEETLVTKLLNSETAETAVDELAFMLFWNGKLIPSLPYIITAVLVIAAAITTTLLFRRRKRARVAESRTSESE